MEVNGTFSMRCMRRRMTLGAASLWAACVASDVAALMLSLLRVNPFMAASTCTPYIPHYLFRPCLSWPTEVHLAQCLTDTSMQCNKAAKGSTSTDILGT